MSATRLAVAGAALLTAVVLGPAGTDTLGTGWGRPVVALVALAVAAVALAPLLAADRWWKQDQADLERLAEPLVWPVQLGRRPVAVHRRSGVVLVRESDAADG